MESRSMRRCKNSLDKKRKIGTGTWVIIVAGGSSRRMGYDKMTADLEGRPVLAWSVEAFNECPSIDAIVLVCAAGELREFEAIARLVAPKKLRAVIEGGAHRQLSVAAGLDCVPQGVSMIAVHDAARPLVTCAMIDRCLETARNTGAAACARPVTDTLKRVNDEGFIVGSVEREHLWAVETPQIFRAELLRHAYEEAAKSDGYFTDETSAVQAVGAPVSLVDSVGWNRKITYPVDLELARLLTRGRAAEL